MSRTSTPIFSGFSTLDGTKISSDSRLGQSPRRLSSPLASDSPSPFSSRFQFHPKRPSVTVDSPEVTPTGDSLVSEIDALLSRQIVPQQPVDSSQTASLPTQNIKDLAGELREIEQKLSLSLSFKFGANSKGSLEPRANSAIGAYSNYDEINMSGHKDNFRVTSETSFMSSAAREGASQPAAAPLQLLPPTPGRLRPSGPPLLTVAVGSALDRGEWTSEGVWKKALPPGADNPPPNLQQIKPDDLVKIRELGRGCFGSVWLARWRGVEVALKELFSQSAPTDAPPTEVFSEAERLAALRHPCILAFYGIVAAPGCCATVVEFMRMGSLKSGLQRLRQQGTDLPQVARGTIALAAARGMEYLHNQAVVHFDLKCDNLLCDLRDLARPVVKIGDLGLSKQKLGSFISGNMRGTLPWMAPELFPSVRESAAQNGHPINGGSADDRVNEKVDVFSYGIVLWEIWRMGEQPYNDIPVNEIFAGVMTGSLRPSLTPDIPEEWVALMQACWQAIPRRRPNFTEISEALEALVEQWSSDAP